MHVLINLCSNWDCLAFSIVCGNTWEIGPIQSDDFSFWYRDYKEYHTDVTVKFVLNMAEDKLAEAEATGLHKKFKLEASINTSNMVSLARILANI